MNIFRNKEMPILKPLPFLHVRFQKKIETFIKSFFAEILLQLLTKIKPFHVSFLKAQILFLIAIYSIKK